MPSQHCVVSLHVGVVVGVGVVGVDGVDGVVSVQQPRVVMLVALYVPFQEEQEKPKVFNTSWLVIVLQHFMLVSHIGVVGGGVGGGGITTGARATAIVMPQVEETVPLEVAAGQYLMMLRHTFASNLCEAASTSPWLLPYSVAPAPSQLV